jgi:hypothetical protein
MCSFFHSCSHPSPLLHQCRPFLHVHIFQSSIVCATIIYLIMLSWAQRALKEGLPPVRGIGPMCRNRGQQTLWTPGDGAQAPAVWLSVFGKDREVLGSPGR